MPPALSQPSTYLSTIAGSIRNCQNRKSFYSVIDPSDVDAAGEEKTRSKQNAADTPISSQVDSKRSSEPQVSRFERTAPPPTNAEPPATEARPSSPNPVPPPLPDTKGAWVAPMEQDSGQVPQTEPAAAKVKNEDSSYIDEDLW